MNNSSEEGNKTQISPFESIRRENEGGIEYWSARDLAKVLDYTQYNKFTGVVRKAEIACENSGQNVGDHFTHVSEMIETGKGAKRSFKTVFLSRYACYLVIQNADPTKEIVALGQTYFAIQTRRQEELDELEGKSDDQKRLYLRGNLQIAIGSLQ